MPQITASSEKGLRSRVLDKIFPGRGERQQNDEKLQHQTEGIFITYLTRFIDHARTTPDLLYTDDLHVLEQIWRCETATPASELSKNPLMPLPPQYRKRILGTIYHRSREESDFLRQLVGKELTPEEVLSLKEAILSFKRVRPITTFATFSLRTEIPVPTSMNFAATYNKSQYQQFLIFVPGSEQNCSHEVIEGHVKEAALNISKIQKQPDKNIWKANIGKFPVTFYWVQSAVGPADKPYQTYFASFKDDYRSPPRTKDKKKKTEQKGSFSAGDLIPMIQT